MNEFERNEALGDKRREGLIDGRIGVYIDKLETRYDAHYEIRAAEDPDDMNLISSALPNGRHKPVLDIDIPARFVESATPGHGHLYLGIELTDEQYKKVLDTLEEVGIIQHGFHSQFARRGATFVRPPWNKKPVAQWG